MKHESKRNGATEDDDDIDSDDKAVIDLGPAEEVKDMSEGECAEVAKAIDDDDDSE